MKLPANPLLPRSACRDRISHEQVEVLLEQLDHAGDSYRGETRRAVTRYTYRLRTCPVRFHQPDTDRDSTFHVKTRNISAGGISFVHAGFVHIGRTCRVQLLNTGGILSSLPGAVKRCRYLGRGMLHEVSVRFGSPVDPSEFASTAMDTSILLAERDPIMARLAVARLHKLNVRVEHVRTAAAAVERSQQKKFDAIWISEDSPGMNGPSATKQLRQAGYDGTIVALLPRAAANMHRRFQEAGCNRSLSKPYTPGELERLVQDLRRSALTSAVPDDGSRAGLVRAFVEGLPETIRQIGAALVAENRGQLEAQSRMLRGLGGSFGFDAMSESAMRVESAIHDHVATEDLARLTDDLLRRCHAARSAALDHPPHGANRAGALAHPPASSPDRRPE